MPRDDVHDRRPGALPARDKEMMVMTLSNAAKAEIETRRSQAAAATVATPPTAEPQEPQDEMDLAHEAYMRGQAAAAAVTEEETETAPADAPETPEVLAEAEAEAAKVPESADDVDEDEPDEEEADPGDEPLPKEYVILNGPASYGPVRIGGKLVRVLREKLYYVPDPRERADVLGTGRFRAGNKADLARASAPSSGPGGALTRDMLPPGAIKGGLVKL